MTAYYNECDSFAAAWLRELIKAGHIAPGDVDERSIEDVCPSDLAGYTQCHFFAGIGVWSYALRQAGWADDRPVWTGSCPCQPFSAAGKKKGFADSRHLWPTWAGLIRERAPSVVFGEQVASKDGYAWLDIVHADLETMGYACGPVVLPVAGFGGPHQRHRIFFVGDANYEGSQGWSKRGDSTDQRAAGAASLVGELEHTHCASQDRWASSGEQPIRYQRCESASALEQPTSEQARVSGLAREQRATGGFWASAEWLYCGDDTLRPVEPGTFPMAHGVAARMDKLRGYGNAICAPVAKEFINAFLRLN